MQNERDKMNQEMQKERERMNHESHSLLHSTNQSQSNLMKEYSFLNNTSTVIIFDGKTENDFFSKY